EDGMIVADRDGTLLHALATRMPAAGADVTLTIRPERMRFAGEEPDMARANRLWATVTETVFAGERRRYLCRCDCGASIVVKEPSSATPRRGMEGERVELAWSVADTVVV